MSVWQLNKGEAVTVKNYRRALENCLSNPHYFELITLGVVVGDSLAGFAVTERIKNDWLLSHFAAANPDFTGLSASLFHHLAKHGPKLGCTHLNYQEDVGDLGLRRFKMKWAPSGFLRKFSVTSKEG